jgi:hypothetical protein
MAKIFKGEEMKRYIGDCPVCGHRLECLIPFGGHNTDPTKIQPGDGGCIHCGDCLALLLWGPGVPLHVASKKEEQDVIDQVGKENYEKLLRGVKDKRAYLDGLA